MPPSLVFIPRTTTDHKTFWELYQNTNQQQLTLDSAIRVQSSHFIFASKSEVKTVGPDLCECIWGKQSCEQLCGLLASESLGSK